MIKTIEDILRQGGIEEYKSEARLLLELTGLSFEELLLGSEVKNKDEIIKLAKRRVETREPVQHIIGYAYFTGDKYLVNKNVLIPRDETEILVRKCYELLKERKDKLDILDIGIGSGCISCALAKKLKDKEIEILGVDISFEALETAIENINRLNLVRKVIVRKSDLFSKIRDCEKFDLIVSNPPYIPILERDNLQFEVRTFDPSIALFAPDNFGISFYKKIIEDAPKFLKKGGCVAFEIGINQKELVLDLLEKDFFKIEVEKDLAGIDRAISAKLK